MTGAERDGDGCAAGARGLLGAWEVAEILQCAQDLLATATLEGRLEYLSPRWHDVLGYEPEELRAAPLFDFVHPADRQQTIDALERLASGRGGVPGFESRLRGNDHRYRRIVWRCRLASSGKVLLLAGQDVTEARIEKEQYQSVVEASPIGLMTVDCEGTIMLANRELERLFGYPAEELIGLGVERLLPERFRGEHAALRQSFLSQPAARMMGAGRDLFGRRKDGSEFLVEIGLNPSSSGNGVYVHCSIADVTARKRQEEELRARVGELQRHHSETDLLSEMSSLLQHAVTEREALDIVGSFGHQLFPDVKAGIYVFPPSGQALELTTSWNAFAGAELLELNECWALRRSQAHRSTRGGAARCPHVEGESASGSACVPMSAHGHLLGLLTLSYDADVTPRAEVHKLESLSKSVADQFGLALSNLQLREKLRNRSIRDPLTDLFNRRYIEETVTREIHRAARRGSTFSLLMIDVDHFKQYNDDRGHQAADEVLREVAATMLRYSRREDAVGRFGGEEFVVVLCDAALADAMARAEEIRTQICDGSRGQVTVSAGVASYPRHGESWETLFEAADAAMYRAKDAGRNRVAAAADGPRPAAACALPRWR